MLHTGAIIGGLEVINDEFDHPFTAIEEAIKVIKMWGQLKKDYGRFDLKERDGMSDIPLVARMKGIENIHFPELITQTVTIEIQGKNEQRLRNTINTIECVEGVKDVRPHDSRY